jgi:excisionase family DNA binding protein
MNPNDDHYIRLPEAAAYCGIAQRTLRAWVRRRIIPSYRPTNRLLLFKKAEIDKALGRFKSC